MSTTKKKGKGSASRIESAISSSLAETVDKGTLASMSRILAQMGVEVAIKSEPTPLTESSLASSKSLPRVTKFEMDFFAIVTNPNQWFLVATTGKKRRPSAFSQYGKCFETTVREDKGHYNHYVRYTGGDLNETGQRLISGVEDKLNTLREAIVSGEVRGMRTASSTSGQGSREVAGRYPLNKEERTFLRLFDNPNQMIVLADDITQPAEWYAFRWKWQTRYGFDLSQIKLSQKKKENGLFAMYGQYVPNSDGTMNDGLAEFVAFLMSKPEARAKV